MIMSNDNHKLGDEAMALVSLAQRSAGTASQTELTRQAGAARDIVIRAWINGRENGRPPLGDLERSSRRTWSAVAKASCRR
jgi:hypothetical protein